MDRKRFGHALEYLEAGLMIESQDIEMLNLKLQCLGNLNWISEAITVQEWLLAIYPDDNINLYDLIELYLIDGNNTK